jgi:hypothetical protein
LKREGPPVAALAILGVVVPSWRNFLAWAPHRRRIAAAATVVAILIVFLCVDFSEQAQATAGLSYHAEVWGKLAQHLFDWSSFHFLFWGAAVVVVVLAASGRQAARTVWLIVALCAFPAAIFLFTPQARFALNDQTPSRLFMQIAPALVLALAAAMAPHRRPEVPSGEPDRREEDVPKGTEAEA